MLLLALVSRPLQVACLVGSAALAVRSGMSRDAALRALTLSEAEFAFQAVIDPYARADFFLAFSPEGVEIDTYAFVTQVFKNIALAKVATSAEEAKAFGYFRRSDGVSFDPERRVAEASA